MCTEASFGKQATVCVDMLRLICDHWPVSSTASTDETITLITRDGLRPPSINEIPSPITHLVTKNFDASGAGRGIGQLSTVLEIFEAKGQTVITFLSENNYPYRAIFLIQNGAWLLSSLLAACPACLGTGKISRDACPLCDGIGYE
jgi:hypothetical protein